MRSRTVFAIPPGATIREQLEDRGMTQKEFAVRMGMSEKHISRMINGEVHLTPEAAYRLEAVLGIPASFWNNLEARYQEKKVIVEEEKAMDADIEIAKRMPYPEMAELGWVEPTRITIERVTRLRSFFEVSRLRLLAYLQFPGLVSGKRSSLDKDEFGYAAWVQKARLEARNVPVSPTDLSRLETRIPEIRRLTCETQEACPAKLPDMLADCGVALVVLPPLRSGARYSVSFSDGKKVVMALTACDGDPEAFRNSLFREVQHILEERTAGG